MPRCRVLVLGCGEGHDAAFFAQNGHIVTGVDISPEAITRAQIDTLHMEI
jgi:2-polyprenyl-3-methyl-5-hydroxy-6-metoxy-1,4-benzoquinol methylase